MRGHREKVAPRQQFLLGQGSDSSLAAHQADCLDTPAPLPGSQAPLSTLVVGWDPPHPCPWQTLSVTPNPPRAVSPAENTPAPIVF